MKLHAGLTHSRYGQSRKHSLCGRVKLLALLCTSCLFVLCCSAKKDSSQTEDSQARVLAKQVEVEKEVQTENNTGLALNAALEDAQNLLPPTLHEQLLVEQKQWEAQGRGADVDAFQKQGMSAAQALEAATFDRLRKINRLISIQFLKENPEQLQGYYQAGDGSSVEIYHYDKENPELHIVLTDAQSGMQLTAIGVENQFLAEFSAESDARASFSISREGKSLTLTFGQDWAKSLFGSGASQFPAEFEMITE